MVELIKNIDDLIDNLNSIVDFYNAGHEVPEAKTHLAMMDLHDLVHKVKMPAKVHKTLVVATREVKNGLVTINEIHDAMEESWRDYQTSVLSTNMASNMSQGAKMISFVNDASGGAKDELKDAYFFYNGISCRRATIQDVKNIIKYAAEDRD